MTVYQLMILEQTDDRDDAPADNEADRIMWQQSGKEGAGEAV